MKSLRAAFKADGEALRQNVAYRLEGFFIDIVDNIAAELQRADPKLTRSDLAALMGVSPARVTNLLRGYKSNIELKTIVQAAIALGVEPNDLCARRTTPEMLSRPLRAVLDNFVDADIAEEVKNGKQHVA